MEVKDLYELHQKAINNINLMNYNEAIEYAEQIEESINNEPYNNIISSGIYIDAGFFKGSQEKVKHGINLIEDVLDVLDVTDQLSQSIYYNLGNGYSNLFKLIKRNNKFYGIFSNSELDKSLKFYRLSEQSKQIDKYCTVQNYVNLGNTLDMMGRHIEAINYYNKALSINKNFGMALGNKGIALKYYSRITGDNWPIYYREAYNLLKEAIKKQVNIEAENTFLKHIKNIEENIDIKKIKTEQKKIDIKTSNDFEEFLERYCIKNNLYLNICSVCQKCSKSISDNIIIRKMIVPINDDENNMEDDLFLRLSSFMNEIKENYVGARYLLVRARYKKDNINYVDKKVKIINTLDYTIQNIYVQLLKFAFKNMYDILDKLSIFLNEYLNLEKNENHVSFNNMWFKKKDINKKIIETRNYNLNALYKTYIDIKDGRYEELKQIRHALTHRYLNIKMFGENNSKKDMTEEYLVDKTIEVCRLVRNCIIYLISFVDEEENKKEKASRNTPLVPLYVEEVPDDLKDI